MPQPLPLPTPDPDAARALRRLAAGFLALVAVTFVLIVLGALVRAHEAGLACPDWPLCFGQLVPAFDVKVAFEWSHRALAGSVSLLFALLAWRVIRRPLARRAAGRLVAVAAVLLVVQVILGGLTVLHLLAAWTVASHLVTGNLFAVSLLWISRSLSEAASGDAPAPSPAWVRPAVGAAAALLALQVVLGGLVSSTFAGLACPEWPTCNGGAWFPSLEGAVGLHLFHRTTAYVLVGALGLLAVALRGRGTLARSMGAAAILGLAQAAVGVANVVLGLPVEVTGLHSALAALLILCVSLAVRAAWRAPVAVAGEHATVLRPPSRVSGER